MQTVPLQQEFCPELPNVYGATDYRQFREMLIKIDQILTASGLEHQLIIAALERQPQQASMDERLFFNSQKAVDSYRHFKHALRCNIARHLTGESYRLFSLRLADSTLFQWFTGINAFAHRKATSKSSLERYEKCFDADEISELLHRWLSGFQDIRVASAIGLIGTIGFSNTLMDSTCIKANIHFPVDWVLLRDAARSLLLAIETIRQQGLKHRMIEPKALLTSMNKLCIRMTHTRRKKGSKKHRKQILREMKKLSHRIEQHATRYRQILLDRWEETDWSEAQMQQVVHRLDNILNQLPAAIKQAHERIIGERQVRTQDKILSLYDKDVAVIVRGKAGGEVEFGQRLLLAEQQDGLIVDWELFDKASPADNHLIEPVINRVEQYYGQQHSVSTDRAFASEDNDKFLESKNIYNATCPRSPTQLQEKLKDPVFLDYQTRRSQTEARIGIFKNVFLGCPLRSRVTANKRHAINWCVLSHNLWVLSRKAIANESQPLQQAA
jgi:hypothetical protein